MGTITNGTMRVIDNKVLTLLMLRLHCPKHKDTKIFDNHLNVFMLVFIVWLWLRSWMSSHMPGFQ